MQRPIAFKLLAEGNIDVHRIRSEPLDIETLQVQKNAPAIVVVRTAAMLADLATGIIDATDIIAVTEGDWSNAILIVDNNIDKEPEEVQHITQSERNAGDDLFLDSVNMIAPSLQALARKTIDLIRSAGVDGRLVEKTKGRWVNAPLNSFTLKAQPRAGNIQFTLYGNPSSYEHDGFLLADQNSYSRGWVNDEGDAEKLASFVKQSHARRTR